MLERGVQAIFATFFGVFMGLFFVVSNSLVGPMIVHGLYDITVFLIGFNEAEILPYESVFILSSPVIANLVVMIVFIFVLRKIYKRPELLRIKLRKKKKNLEESNYL